MQTDDGGEYQPETPLPFSASPMLPDVAADISFAEAQRAEKTIRRLKRGSPVRKLARDVMNRRPISDAQPLLASLADTSRPAQERETAAWTLGWTPLNEAQRTQAAALLRDVLEGEQAPDPKRFQRMAARTLLAGLPLTLLYLLWLNQADVYIFRFDNLFNQYISTRAWKFCTFTYLQLTVFSLFYAAPMSLVMDRRRSNRVRASAAVALGRLQSVEAIGALTAALYDRSVRVRRAGASALKNILPLLTAAHYGQLGVQVIPNLCRALEQNDEVLALHVLSALEQVGDGRAAQPVEQIAANGRTERLRNMAAQVLPVLQERRRQEKASQMLLRASTPTAPGADVLLRPAADPAIQLTSTREERDPVETRPADAERPSDAVHSRSSFSASSAASSAVSSSPRTYTGAEETAQTLRHGGS